MIGEMFKDWCGGEDILISSPTGSGKTHFILKTLLPFAKSQNCTILYLCNRKVLYEQINNATSEEDRRYIQIHTYQEIEYKVRILHSYAYHIFDEAHYFFQDSIFNPRTARWYRALYERNLRPSHARIFISATSDDLRMLLQPIPIDKYINFYISKCKGKARAAIKYLVADGRYDYIETGSLMSIRKKCKEYYDSIGRKTHPNVSNGF